MLVEECAQCETAFAQRKREVQMQMTTMQQHMESLLRVVSDTTARTTPVNHHVDVKLVPLSEKNDIEAYLVTFKRIMAAHEIRRDQWPYSLAPQLTGKAQQAFAALSATEARDYNAIKAAILARYYDIFDCCLSAPFLGIKMCDNYHKCLATIIIQQHSREKYRRTEIYVSITNDTCLNSYLNQVPWNLC